MSTKEDLDHFKEAIGNRFPAAPTYLHRAWLLYEEMWAHHVKCFFTFGIFTTNITELEDRHLEQSLSMRSILFDDFSIIVQRTDELDEARRGHLVEEFPGRSASLRGMETNAELLSRICQFSRCTAEGHIPAYKLVYLQKVGGLWKVGCSRSCGARVLIGFQPSCAWTFWNQRLLPCSHILRVSSSLRCDVGRLPVGR